MSERKREREKHTTENENESRRKRGHVCVRNMLYKSYLFIQFYIRPNLFFIEHRSFCYSIYVYVVFTKFTIKFAL